MSAYINQLWIPLSRIRGVTELGTNISDLKIQIAIKEAQDYILESILGTSLFSYIDSSIASLNKGEVLDEPYKTLVEKYCWPVIIHGTDYFIAERLLFIAQNQAYSTMSTEQSNPISLEDLKSIKFSASVKYNYDNKKLQRWLSENSTQFPSYYSSNRYDLPPSDEDEPIYFV